jgi:hypothetical protein
VTIDECKEGVRVRYVPFHVHGNAEHPHCQDGAVTHVRGPIVFVKFGEHATPQACNAEMLVAL